MPMKQNTTSMTDRVLCYSQNIHQVQIYYYYCYTAGPYRCLGLSAMWALGL